MIYKFGDFLNEGRYDKSILDITREFINEFKETFGVEYKYTTEFEYDKFNLIKLTITTKPNFKIKYAFDIEARSQVDIIDIAIVYNPDFFPFSYNNLIAEIKHYLRHEFTHIKQYAEEQEEMVDREEDEEDFLNKPSRTDAELYNDEELDIYLFHPDEIEAFVNGFYKEAKTKKQSFTKTIDKWLDINYPYFKDKSNVTKIRKIWQNDFKKRYGAKYL